MNSDMNLGLVVVDYFALARYVEGRVVAVYTVD